jgi:transcriptional regulator with XRE-family HTH domain
MKEPETLPETWRALIRWLADTYHHGALYPMAARVGVSSGVIDQWEKGVVKTPSYASIVKVAQAYDIDPTRLLPFAVPPEVRHILTPPPPRPRARTPRPIRGGSGQAAPLPSVPAVDTLPLIRRRPRPRVHIWGLPAWAPTRLAA